MGSLRDGLLEGLKGAYCSYINALPDWYKNWARLTTPQGLNQLSDWVTTSLCNRPPTEDDYPPPPFVGGQCPVRYRVRGKRMAYPGAIDGVCTGTPSELDTTATVWGPVNGIRLSGPINCTKDGNVSRTQYQILCHGLAPVSGSPRATEQAWFSMGSLGAAYSIRIDVVERIDGLPDDCGSPPFNPGPFEPTPINIDIDVTYGPNNEYNLTIPVVIAPIYVAFDGTLNAPVSFNISPDISLEGTWTLFPDANLTIKFPTSGDDGPGDRGDDEPAPDTEHDDPTEDDPDTPGQSEDSEDAPSRIHFLLCRAAIQDNSPTGSIFQEVGPDIYIPRLGSARFGATIDGVTFWTEDIDIKGLNSIIECPIPFGATRFTVNAARGVVINYSPVSADPGPWPNYLEMGPQFTSDRR